MKRYAILIESSNVMGYRKLPGAELDVKNLSSFLRSDLGGNWNSDDIEIFKKPTSKLIKEKLASKENYDYCLVLFTGHGYFDARENVTRVLLNDTELNVSINELKPKSKKGTIIVDACRGIETSPISFSESVLKSESRLYQSALDSIPNQSGKLWFEKLTACQTGIVTMYACKKGEEADEDPNAGGYYVTALMKVAEKWEKGIKSGNKSWYSTKNAHDDVLKYFQSARPQQNPEYLPTHLIFPWAVKI